MPLDHDIRPVSWSSLQVESWNDADPLETDHPPLARFLEAFNSLERLIVNGYYVSVGPIGRHSGLKDLCLHSFERNGDGDSSLMRPTLDIEQLQELDKLCPDLETLEIDLYRNCGWPEPVLKTLATGFRKLRRLTLHLELGLDPHRRIHMKPLLTEDSAKKLGEQFFGWRWPTNLRVLVLKTGEPLRRRDPNPKYEPPYFRIELENEKTVEVYRPRTPGDVPDVTVTCHRNSSYP